MKTNARVVVVGGGMMGASLLYHLALEGCTDTVLIEKNELTSGSTWHAAGQCPSITGSYNLAKIHAYSNELYPKLEALTGQYVSWHPSGGLRLATNADELAWLKYVYGYSKSIGFRMEIVGLDEIKRLNPFLTTDKVIAAAWTPDDGHGDPSGLCNALAKAARDLGATVMRHNRVLDIRPRTGGEWEVVTEQGSIVAEMVVNAAGCYARQVAAMVGADAPITNMQHHYVVTHPIPAFMARSEEIPVMRDSYTSGYFRQEQKSGLMGIYENAGLQEAWAPRGFPEWEASNELFPDDLDRIAPWLERAIERMPIFGEVGIRRVINGAIPHTPDGAPLLGPAAGLKNFWMCCGTSFGIAQGGGCGKYLAQWMLHGDAEINMAEFDPRRFGAFADCELRARQGVPGLSIDLHHAPARRRGNGRASAQDESAAREASEAGLRAHRDLRLGAPQMVLARRPRRRIWLRAQQCIRRGARRSRGRARARRGSGSDGIREIRHQRARSRSFFESRLRQPSAAQDRAASRWCICCRRAGAFRAK